MSERFLRVSVKQNISPVERAQGLLAKAHIGTAPVRAANAPESLEVSRSFGWTKHLRLGEEGRVAAAMQQLAPVADGTRLHPSHFTVEDVRVKADGTEKAKRLRRHFLFVKSPVFMGWEGAVARAGKRALKRNRYAAEHVVKGVAAGVLAEEAARHAQLQVVEPAEKQTRISRGIAKRVANVVAGNPVKNAEAALKPGSSQLLVDARVRNVFRRLEDGAVDPFNVVHGLMEGVIQGREALAKVPGAALLMDIAFARSKTLNRIFNEDVVNINKWTSRDTLRTKLGVTLYTEWYAGVLDHRFFNHPDELLNALGLAGKVIFQRLVPNPTRIDEAADRQTGKADLIALAGMQDLMQGQPANPLLARHQESVAHAVVGTLTEKRLVTDEVSQRLNAATARIERQVNAIPEQIRNNPLVQGVLNHIPQLGRINLRDRVKEAVGATPKEETARRADVVLKEATGQMFEASRNMLEYYRGIANGAEGMLATPGLSAADALRIQRAKEVADKVLEAYHTAQGVVAASHPTRRTV